MPLSVASDLGLHCLSMSHNKDDRLIWINDKITICMRLVNLNRRCPLITKYALTSLFYLSSDYTFIFSSISTMIRARQE